MGKHPVVNARVAIVNWIAICAIFCQTVVFDALQDVAQKVFVLKNSSRATEYVHGHVSADF